MKWTEYVETMQEQETVPVFEYAGLIYVPEYEGIEPGIDGRHWCAFVNRDEHNEVVNVVRLGYSAFTVEGDAIRVLIDEEDIDALFGYT